MKNVPKILLRTYLRRQPVHLRLSRFNFLTRYGWLRNLLEDLKPELFPQRGEEGDAESENLDSQGLVSQAEEKAAPEAPIQLTIKGKKGVYVAECRLGKRGNGELFEGKDVTTQQSVAIKEYELPTTSRFTPTDEEDKIQQAFSNLAGFQYLDSRERDIRVIRPIEAIDAGRTHQEISPEEIEDSDLSAHRRFYLVTERQDACPSLRKQLLKEGAFHPHVVRTVLLQILQTLSVLHQQKITLPSGQIWPQLTHGNLSLDSVLWVEENGYPFVYLSDFVLWEAIFEPIRRAPAAAIVQSATKAQDLKAAGQIAHRLLTGNLASVVDFEADDAAVARASEDIDGEDVDDGWAKKGELDPFLKRHIRQLLGIESPSFETAEAAWRSLLAQPIDEIAMTQGASPFTSQPAQQSAEKKLLSRSVLVAVGAAALAVAGSLAWFLTPRTQGQLEMNAPASTCCLQEVGGIPFEDFSYVYLQDGTWEAIRQQRYLGPQRQPLELALTEAQEGLRILSQPANSPEEAILAVQSGEVNFAILPLWSPDLVPPGMGVETIAYDGLAAVVSFSYAERKKGLPEALDGELSLAALKRIYLGSVSNWEELGGPKLPINRYLSNSPEVFPISVQRVHGAATLNNLEGLETQPMLQTIISDFEAQQTGSVGLIPLSQIFGQCSVYPLAVSVAAEEAVQPWQLVTGERITPKTDLCDRKGLYRADSRLFRSGDYPLAYPIVVVYSQDNSRSPAGRKFVELMQTVEGQQLLFDAGLVPLQEITP